MASPTIMESSLRVLATLGRDAEALEQYREAVAVSVRQDPEESGLGVAVERYFMCEHLLKMNRPEEALEAIEHALHFKQLWLAHVVQSDALWKLGRREESKTAVRSRPGACEFRKEARECPRASRSHSNL